MFLLELVATLSKANVPFCLVGGYAVALHGAVRGTIDIDIAIAFLPEKFEKLEEALRHLGLEPRLPLKASEVFQFREEYMRERNLIAWGFVDLKNPSRQVDVILTHSVEELQPQIIKVRGVRIPVASLEGLIQMKEASPRPQDQEDTRALKAILKSRKP